MSALKCGLPRVFKNHQTREGTLYREYLVALDARLGPLPKDCTVWRKEAGKLVVELDRLAHQQEAAQRKRQTRVANRLSRRQTGLRAQLARIEAQLEARAKDAYRQLGAEQWRVLTQERSA